MLPDGSCPWDRPRARSTEVEIVDPCGALSRRLELFAGLTRSTHGLLVLEEAFHIERSVLLEHEVGGAPEARSQDAECFAIAMALAQPLDESLAARVVVQEADSRFREGPLEMGIADFPSAAADALPAELCSGLTRRQ